MTSGADLVARLGDRLAGLRGRLTPDAGMGNITPGAYALPKELGE